MRSIINIKIIIIEYLLANIDLSYTLLRSYML